MMARLFCIGDLTVDHLIGPFDRLPDWGQEVTYATAERRVGGNSGNVALAARHLGLEVDCWGPVGADADGRWLVAQLQAAGIGTRRVIVDPILPTSTTTALIRADGERAFLTLPGALDAIAAHLPAAVGEAADIAIFSGWCQPPRVSAAVLRDTVARLRETIPLIAFDLAWFDGSWPERDAVLAVLGDCDVVLMNQEEILALFPGRDLTGAVQALADRLGDVAIAVKRGRAGVLLAGGGRPVVAVVVEDPVEGAASVGTGDSFNAAFLAAFSPAVSGGRRGDPGAAERAARFAVAYVSHVLRHGRSGSYDMSGLFQPPTHEHQSQGG